MLSVLDLFCGAGGLSEGFRQAGFSIVAGIDHDPDACATYSLNFPGAMTVNGDLADRVIRSQVVDVSAGVDVIVGGPPCQSFSQVRNHDRDVADPRNRLYREFCYILDLLRPRAFVMENVPGLAQLHIQQRIAEDLTLRGEYAVSVHIVNACDFGVPQTRKRLFFVGIRSSIGVERITLRGTGASERLSLNREVNGSVSYRPTWQSRGSPALLERLLCDDDDSIVTIKQAISDLAFLRAGSREDVIATADIPGPYSEYQRRLGSRLGPVSNVSVPRINKDTTMRLSAIPEGGNYLDLPIGLRERYLTGKRWGPSNGTGRLGRRHYYAYRRLHPDFWSWTLNTKADSTYHWSVERALSVREFARIQSFPDDFSFVTDPRRGPLAGRIRGGAAHSRYRQVGNAVPPLVGRCVAAAVRVVLER